MKKRVGVVFGGRSVEHEISVISAMQAMDAIDATVYEVVPIYIAQDGKWFTGNELRKRDFYKKIPAVLNTIVEVELPPVPGVGGLRAITKGMLARFSGNTIIPIDVYIPIFHGQYGEDGCIQGLFELADVPYAGSGVLPSAVAMNKHVCKAVLASHHIPVLPDFVVKKEEAGSDIMAACDRVIAKTELSSFPLFVKPVNLGSSVGVSKANTKAELAAGLAKVFKFDCEAIVEPCIDSLLEINVSVIEGISSDKILGPKVSVVEIPVASGAFLSYEDKYMREGKGKKGGASASADGMAGLTRVIDPDNLDEGYRSAVCENALKAYQVLGCAGVVRFDFMVDLKKEELYFNELNPIPGSLSFYLWERSDPTLLLSDILDRIITGAIERFAKKKQLNHDFGFKVLSK